MGWGFFVFFYFGKDVLNCNRVTAECYKWPYKFRLVTKHAKGVTVIAVIRNFGIRLQGPFHNGGGKRILSSKGGEWNGHNSRTTCILTQGGNLTNLQLRFKEPNALGGLALTYEEPWGCRA